MTSVPKGETASPPSLMARTASGAVWLVAQNLFSRLLGFAGQLVLAKILTPADFGVIGTALTFYNLAIVGSVFGFDQVLMRRAARHSRWFVAALTTVVAATVLTVAAMLLLLAVLPVASKPDVLRMLIVLSPGILAMSVGTLPQVIIQGRMEFRFLAGVSMVEGLLLQVLTIGLALTGIGAISFAIATTAVAVGKAALLYTRATSLNWAWSRVSYQVRLIKAGSVALGSRLLGTLIDQGDYIIISIVGGITDVGFYFFAFRLSAQAMRTVAGSLANVLVPALVSIQERPRQAMAAFRAAEVLAFVAMPVCFVQIILAAPLITLLFGSKWFGSIQYIQILSAGLPFDAMAWTGGALLTARGQYRLLFRINLACVVLFVALAGTGAAIDGARGVALGVACYYAIHGVAVLHLVFGRDIEVMRVVRCYLFPAGVCLLASASTLIDADPLVEIVLRSLAFAAVFFGCYAIFARGMLRNAWSLVASRGRAISTL